MVWESVRQFFHIQAVQLIFGESGIVPAAFVAIILNVILPKDE